MLTNAVLVCSKFVATVVKVMWKMNVKKLISHWMDREMLIQGGMYLVTLLNTFGPAISILFVVFVEAAGVCWFYGVERFSNDIEKMLGHRPGLFWRICWSYISPVFLLVIFIFSLLGDDGSLSDEVVYPPWSISVGWVLTCSSLICIPAYIIYKMTSTPGTFRQRLSKSFKPESLAEETTLNVNSTYGTGTHV